MADPINTPPQQPDTRPTGEEAWNSLSDVFSGPGERHDIPQKPTGEELWEQMNGGYSGPGAGVIIPKTGSFSDHFFQSTALGRVMSAFGEGFGEGWGDVPFGVDPKTEAELRKSGMWADYTKGRGNILQATNEAWMRPAAAAIKPLTDPLGFAQEAMAGFGAAAKGIGGALEQTAKESENIPGIGQYVAPPLGEAGEILGSLPEGAVFGDSIHLTDEQVVQAIQNKTSIPAHVTAARANAVIGEGEGGFLGTKKPTTAEAQARNEAIGQLPSPLQPKADIHTVAAQMHPELFTEWDQLGKERTDLLTRIQQMTAERDAAKESTIANDPQIKAAQDEINTILSKVGGNEERLTKKAAARLQETREGLDAYTDDLQKRLSQDSEELTNIKEAFRQNFQRAADISPTIKAIYREAAWQVGTENVVHTPQEVAHMEEAQKAVEAAQVPETKPEPTQAPDTVRMYHGSPDEKPRSGWASPNRDYAENYNTAGENEKNNVFYVDVPKGHPDEVSARNWTDQDERDGLNNVGSYKHIELSDDMRKQLKPVEAPAFSIADDINKKLLKAGRSSEEARAGGQLVEAYYTTRAKRFKGALGTAEELYRREGPTDIVQEEGNGRGVFNRTTRVLKLLKNADASTFLHEMGHTFLWDLLKDAEHEKAPSDVINDAEMVKKWLGYDDKTDIFDKKNEAKNEKWARGFERWLREGVAPTKELAGLFQQFRTWLMQIYSNVKKLRVTINPDIKDVFARLLAESPDYTTLVPDEVVPHEAPEVESATQAGKSEPIQTSAPETKQPASQARAGASFEEQVEEFHQTDKYIDKAGNMNLDNISSDEGIRGLYRAFAERNREFLNARKFNWSQQDIIDAAEALGASPRKMMANMSRLKRMSYEDKVPLAVRILALREAVLQSAKDLMEKVQNDDVAGYAGASLRHLELQKLLSGVTAEWGRAGTAFKVILDQADKDGMLEEFFQSNLGKSFEQVKREANAMKALDTPGKVSKQNLKMAGPSMGEMLMEYTQMNYISGLFTHVQYALGNKLFALYKVVPEPLAKALTTQIHTALKPEEQIQRVYYREVLAGLHGLFWGQADGWQAVKIVMKTDEMHRLEGEGTVRDIARKKAAREGLIPGSTESENRITEYSRSLIKRMATARAKSEGLKGADALARIEELMDDHEKNPNLSTPTSVWTPSKYIPNDVNLRNTPYIGRFLPETKLPVGSVVRFPGRIVTAIHAADRAAGMQAARSMLCMRQALDENLTGSALTARWAELYNDTPDRILEQARDEADEQALLQRSGDLSARFQRVLNYRVQFPSSIPLNKLPYVGKVLPEIPFLGKTPVFRFAQMFVNISSQIWETWFIQRSPLGIALSSDIRDNLMGKNGTYAQDMSIAKISLGTSALLGFAAWKFSGILNPRAPANHKEATVNQMVNGLPHSIRIGNMSFALDRLGVMGQMMAIGTDLGQAAEYALEGDFHKAGMYALWSFYNSTMEMWSGLADFQKANDNPDSYGDWFYNNWLSGEALPYSIFWQQTAKFADPYQREAHGFWETMMSKIPFLSEELEAKIDLFGQPVPNKEFWGVYTSQVTNDPAWLALEHAGYFPAPCKREIRGIQLTEHQYNQYAVRSGLVLHQLILQRIQVPGYEQLSQGAKMRLLTKDVEDSRKRAESSMLIEYHDTLMVQANQKKIDSLK